ncbi:hypothetical protein IPH67_00095 [bacterium]|nr:MAG: hypothetical protein IPH67_00095 [bacterium]
MLKKLQTKNQLASEQLSSLIGKNKTAGFCACYAGFIGVSNHEGYINFTRKHATPVIYLAITQEIVPVMRVENTVSHWQFIKDAPVTFYKLTADEHAAQATWNIIEIEVPENLVIPSETIIVFGNPAHFYFSSDTKESKHMTLPNIALPPLMITKEANPIKSSLFLLSVRHLFASAEPTQNKQFNMYQLITPP